MSDLFRKKSLDKISSPERINDYIKTPRASSLAALIAALALIAGALVWGIFGRLDITLAAVTVCENGKAVCYVSEYDAEHITEGTSVRIDGDEFSVAYIPDLPVPAKDTVSGYAAHIGGFDENGWVYALELNGEMTDGIYKTDIVTERVSPVSLLLN